LTTLTLKTGSGTEWLVADAKSIVLDNGTLTARIIGIRTLKTGIGDVIPRKRGRGHRVSQTMWRELREATRDMKTIPRQRGRGKEIQALMKRFGVGEHTVYRALKGRKR